MDWLRSRGGANRPLKSENNYKLSALLSFYLLNYLNLSIGMANDEFHQVSRFLDPSLNVGSSAVIKGLRQNIYKVYHSIFRPSLPSLSHICILWVLTIESH